MAAELREKIERELSARLAATPEILNLASLISAVRRMDERQRQLLETAAEAFAGTDFRELNRLRTDVQRHNEMIRSQVIIIDKQIETLRAPPAKSAKPLALTTDAEREAISARAEGDQRRVDALQSYRADVLNSGRGSEACLLESALKGDGPAAWTRFNIEPKP